MGCIGLSRAAFFFSLFESPMPKTPDVFCKIALNAFDENTIKYFVCTAKFS